MTKLSKLLLYLCPSVFLSSASCGAAKVKVGALEMNAKGPIDSIPVDIADSIEEEVEQKPKGAKKGDFVVAPLPSSSRDENQFYVGIGEAF